MVAIPSSRNIWKEDVGTKSPVSRVVQYAVALSFDPRTTHRGESGWLSTLRGLLALFSICSLIAFGIYQAVIAPISEMGMTPYRQYRAARLGPDTREVIDEVTWRLLLVSLSSA